MTIHRRARLLGALLTLALVPVLAAPAASRPALRQDDGGMKTLGTDPANDALPALDITSLSVGLQDENVPSLHAANLEIRIGIDKMLPVVGGYDSLPGIEWIFDVKRRAFVAEAFVQQAEARFVLFELKGEAFEQVAQLEGTYDWTTGYISMVVPLHTIGATKHGTVVSGHGKRGTVDVDAHVHLGTTTHYADEMASTKDYVVP